MLLYKMCYYFQMKVYVLFCIFLATATIAEAKPLSTTFANTEVGLKKGYLNYYMETSKKVLSLSARASVIRTKYQLNKITYSQFENECVKLFNEQVYHSISITNMGGRQQYLGFKNPSLSTESWYISAEVLRSALSSSMEMESVAINQYCINTDRRNYVYNAEVGSLYLSLRDLNESIMILAREVVRNN